MRQFSVFAFFLCSFYSIKAQRPLHYFGQVSYGSSGYSEVGKGNISAGFFNADSVADIGFAGKETFQFGYGFIENGVLKIELKPVQFYLPNQSFQLDQIADIDSDGDLDFAMEAYLSFQEHETYWFENQGDSLPFTYEFVPAPFPNDEILHFGHYNQDSIIDAFFDNGSPNFMDGATGQVHQPIRLDANLTPYDFNGDGLMDFHWSLSSNFPPYLDGNRVYLNKGNFTFDTLHTSTNQPIDGLGDFDGDGNMDILSQANFYEFQLKTHLLTNDSAQIFTILTHTKIFSAETERLVYDLNQDMYDDILLFKSDSIFFYENKRDMTFEVHGFALASYPNPKMVSHPSWPKGTFVSHSLSGVPEIYTFRFDSLGFSASRSRSNIAPHILPEPPYYYNAVALDVDLDGKMELAIAHEQEFLAAELDGMGFGAYKSYVLDSIFPEQSQFAVSAVTDDFNKDGYLDLIYADAGFVQGNIWISYGRQDSTFSASQRIVSGFKLNFDLESADFDGNGFPDFVVSGGDKLSVFLNQNGTQFIENQIDTIKYDNINLIDPNGDGFADLAVSKMNTRIFMNDGLGNFTRTQSISGKLAKSSVQDSSFIYQVGNDFISLYKISPDGTDKTLVASRAVPGANNSRESYMLDYNKDGMPDVVFNAFDTARVVLGTIMTLGDTKTLENWKIRDAVDIDGDGVQDPVWQIGSQIWVELVDEPIWTDILALPALKNLSIFPNPTSDFLNFEIPEETAKIDEMQIEIWDMTGRLLFSKKQNRGVVDVRFLGRGSYFLLLKNAGLGLFGGQFLRM